jgi:hypothetical protein
MGGVLRSGLLGGRIVQHDGRLIHTSGTQSGARSLGNKCDPLVDDSFCALHCSDKLCDNLIHGERVGGDHNTLFLKEG